MVHRFLCRPLGVLTRAALAALLCGLFLHPQGFVLSGGVLAVIALGFVWPWLALPQGPVGPARPSHRLRGAGQRPAAHPDRPRRRPVRPRRQTVASWLCRALPRSSQEDADLDRLTRLAEWAAYAPDGPPPWPEGEVRAVCRRVLKSWALYRWRRGQPISANGART